MSDPAPNPARIPWLLRRGMKELDILVTRYYERDYPHASPEDQALFLALLTEVEDPDIWAWSMGYQAIPERFQALFAVMNEA
jgi:antitoxin CptB